LINPFLLSDRERILSWRQLRASIKTIAVYDACECVAKWWSHAAIHPHGLDCYDYEAWADPWVMLEQNYFNKNTVAYMMHKTFELSDQEKFSSQLILIHDYDLAVDDIYWVALVDSKYILNYNVAKVDKFSEIEKNIAIKLQYT
jgi:hypothetical protein